MNIIAAVKSGKRFRREGYNNWFPFNADHYNSVSKQDILATDWEIEERKVEITEWELLKLIAIAEAAERFEKAIGQKMPSSYPEFFKAEYECVKERRELRVALSKLTTSRRWENAPNNRTD